MTEYEINELMKSEYKIISSRLFFKFRMEILETFHEPI